MFSPQSPAVEELLLREEFWKAVAGMVALFRVSSPPENWVKHTFGTALTKPTAVQRLAAVMFELGRVSYWLGPCTTEILALLRLMEEMAAQQGGQREQVFRQLADAWLKVLLIPARDRQNLMDLARQMSGQNFVF